MRKYFLLSILLLSVTFYVILTNPKAEMTLTYFPIDDEQQFTVAKTSLRPIEQTNTIEWISESDSEVKLYLRQDIALLFTNGTLSGVLNKWAQHVDHIKQSEQLQVTPNTMLEAISFHHGEHHHNENITSIQQISADKLYIFNNNTVRTPQSSAEQERVTDLDNEVSGILANHWEKLMSNFDINSDNYVLIPLTKIDEIYKYFPDTIEEKTSERIIGQLWEGLYKNYVLAAIESEAKDLVPLILLAKDFTHLQVLYTMKGEKIQLIQQINLVENGLTE